MAKAGQLKHGAEIIKKPYIEGVTLVRILTRTKRHKSVLLRIYSRSIGLGKY